MEIANQAMVNWVYDFSDYQQMYDLTIQDLTKSILDFPAGISSFNATATQKNMRVVSGDTIYSLSEQDMQSYAKRAIEKNIARLHAQPERLRNPDKSTMQEVMTTWKIAENNFLQDYHKGQAERRYQAIQLPVFPYKKHEFDLALCTDFLFYHAVSDEKIVESVRELCRVAAEVRIFPLLDEFGKTTDELGPLLLHLQQHQFGVEVREVAYKTLKGGNAMLRIWSQTCEV